MLSKLRFDFCEVLDDKRRMGLRGRNEHLFHADVQLLRAALKPASAALGQFSGLRDLQKTENFSEEPPGLFFASGGRGQLHVVDSEYHPEIIAPPGQFAWPPLHSVG